MLEISWVFVRFAYTILGFSHIFEGVSIVFVQSDDRAKNILGLARVPCDLSFHRFSLDFLLLSVVSLGLLRLLYLTGPSLWRYPGCISKGSSKFLPL